MVHIMVVKREKLFGNKNEHSFQGFMPLDQKDFSQRTMNNFTWMERNRAETNEEYKQPVPYVLVYNRSSDKFFVYRRSSKGSEDRLHAKTSIGIGGHVEMIDNFGNPVMSAMLREMKEEIFLTPINMRLLGFINNDIDSVGRVHFGFCYLVETESDAESNESFLEDGRMLGLQQLNQMEESFELWSKIAYGYVKTLILNGESE